eukprot:TRINITY_DN23454_c0_g1_i1.p1 TRINITY_DN23454_c0_g1~~TRINITY_DN23454_c0_g1_i1.p1  ORF type:complete len:1288 (+),score=192.78 TRINITY_DN23454_c0_g1_i1:407-3865(+)
MGHVMPQVNFHGSRMGATMRFAVQQLVFRTSLTMSLETKQAQSANIVNLMSVDSERFFTVCQSLFVINSFLTIIASAVILSQFLNWYALSAVLLFALAMPLQVTIGKRLGRFRGLMSKHMAARMSATSNFLTGIRIVKASGWVDPALQVIAKHRQLEVSELRKVLLCRGANLTIAFVVTPLATLTMFGLYAVAGNGPMQPERVFTALAALRGLQMPMMMMPVMVSNIFEFLIAKNRVENFLCDVAANPGGRAALKDTSKSGGCVTIEKASFAWATKETQNQEAHQDSSFTGLQGIDLKIKQGELVVILGPTGSGKTSLLMAMLGEMPQREGSVDITGKVALAGQEPWICSCSLKDNVVFRNELDKARYDASLRESVLVQDLEALPDGEHTEIGERGINLSGGQKARVALARALYRSTECDIYMLDDTLSAVDAHVGQQIVERALLGALSSKTRIMVVNTFLPVVLPKADRIIVMSGGQIEVQGNVQACLSASAWLRSIYSEQSANAVIRDAEHSKADARHGHRSSEAFQTDTKPDGKKGILYQQEDRAIGVLQLSVYKAYFGEAIPQKPGSGLFVFIVLMALITAAECFRVGHDWIIMLWVQNHEQGADFDGHKYWYVRFAICVGGVVVFGFIRAYAFMVACAKISQHTHDRMLKAVLSASVPNYFDVTPLGRILNRFSKDLDSLDMQLPLVMFDFLQAFMFIMGVIVMASASSYGTLAVLLPLVVVFYCIRWYFSCTSRELKRLEAITRSPLYSMFTEMVNGLAHLRAFGMLEKQASEFDNICERNFKVFFHLHALTGWLINRLDMVGVSMILSISLSVLWVPRTAETAAAIGFGLTAATSLMGRLFHTVNLSIETENHMTSVERLQHFETIPKERSTTIEAVEPPEAWTQAGHVQFKGVCMRYRDELPLVLKNLSFEALPGERVGIVGRTGCGKSSTMLALLRLVGIESGQVLLDGVDIRSIPLQRLRGQAVALIPQDPYLFVGPVRQNLDPFGRHSDGELWEALANAQLTEVVQTMGGLDAPIVEGGENLSAGQRQLFCIARVMLQRCRVVLMDEATANIDTATDALIQKSIAEAFRGSTVLTIAHRLDTVVDADKVVVLDAGAVVEYGAPAELFAGGGVFADLAKNFGLGPNQRTLAGAKHEQSLVSI